jgi:thioredoxin-like negative regulator of GroEL
VTDAQQRPMRVADGDELDAVLASHDTVLVEFYTKGCTLCQAIEPVLGNVARETGIPVAMVNPGEDVSLVDEWNVRSVPTLALVADGEEIARLADGFQGGDAIEAFVRENR